MKKLLANLSTSQKISIAVIAIAVVGVLVGFTRWRHEGDFRPLYSGLASEDAAAVVQKLKETGTDYRLSEDGGTVSAPSARIAELRLQLAAGGIPKSGRMGFELFDKSSFGMTDFAEHVNYRRALEGELERSVMSLEEVERARVHLTFPKESVYLEARQPAKASVILGLRRGASLSSQNVSAVCNLVASAVEGLAPERVSVVDSSGNLLSRPRRSEDEGSAANLEYRDGVEKGLLNKIQSTLEPLLGADRYRATVFADCDLSTSEQSEETFDPTKSVMVSSQKSEDVAPATLSLGIPGTASNLPRPPVRPAGSASGASRRNEEITYQSSRVVRHVNVPQGELKRVSVTVLLDQDMHWEGAAASLHQVLVPPSADKIKTIHDLVAGVIDYNAGRGDQLIVETLPFEATLHTEPPAPPAAPAAPKAAPQGTPVPAWLKTKMGMGAAAGAAVLLLAVAAAGIRLMRRRKAPVAVLAALPAGPQKGAAPALAEGKPASRTIDQAEAQARLEAETLEAIKTPAAASNKKDVLTKYLQESLKKDHMVQVQTLRNWLTEKA